MAIITVSRGSMSGGTEFAECLAQRLHYKCVSREVVLQAAEKIGVSEKMLLGKIEKSAGLWERLTTDRRIYLLAVQATLADECTSGDLVYHGHAGHFLLKGLPTLLKVRLIAPMAMRIRAVMERQGISYDHARDYIRNVDHERIRWTRFVYGVDWRNPANYDLVINLADMSIDSACATVAAVARLAPYRNSEIVLKELRDFALACRVKLALAQTTEFRGINFDAKADDGRVEILAEVPGNGLLTKHASLSEEDIGPIVEGIRGIEEWTVNIHRFPEGTQA
jgi:cytidylate kinase